MSTENIDDQQLVEELAKPENVEEYVAERREQEEEAAPPESEHEKLVKDVREKNPELKRASRSKRYKLSRDRLAQENQQLRERYEPAADERVVETADHGYEQPSTTTEASPELTHSLETARATYGQHFDAAYKAFVDHVSATRDMDAYNRVMNSAHPGEELVRWNAENPYAAQLQEGRQFIDQHQRSAERDDEVRLQTECRMRAEAFAAQNPDFMETVQSIEGVDHLPPQMMDMIRRSPVSAEIAYRMAKDYWDPNSVGILEVAQSLAHDPIAQARYIGALEQAIINHRTQESALQQRAVATKAPPPLSPVRGGASPPRDLNALASGDDASDYIRARRSR